MNPHVTPSYPAEVLNRLKDYIEAQHYAGYDPYDILNSPIPFHWAGTFAGAVVTQLHKRNPFNIRPLLGIKKAYNPKGLGLLLHAYSNLQRLHPEHDYSRQLDTLLTLIGDCVSKGYKGVCWGYNFPWASPGKYLPRYAPSGVVTAFVAKGLHAYVELTSSTKAKDMLTGTADFIRNELPVSVDSTGSCISYTPFKQDFCYNASLLAAETLARVYTVSGDDALRQSALSAASYVIARQHNDGRWNYSRNETTGVEREQVDFHQGFVIDSLSAIQHLTATKVKGGDEAIRLGLAFYRDRQFTPDGRSLWRFPRQYPVDIHNQAQGIITFARHGDPFAATIAQWTIANMCDEQKGYFHYRKYPYFTNRISYMRWSNAWMMLALTELAMNGTHHNRLP